VAREENWNVEEIRRIEPRVISLDKPIVVSTHASFE
jgi:hypothetical protein